MRLQTPVDVSLCTTITARIECPGSEASSAASCSGSAPWRQSPGDGGDLEAEVGSNVAPQGGELADVEAHDAVAR